MTSGVPPLMPVWRWYEFGKQLGAAIRSFEGLERVAVVGCGGLSHWIGNPRVGDINEEFDRWFCERLERGEIDQVLDMKDDEIEPAGNGNHEMRTWGAVAGGVGGAPGCSTGRTPRSPARAAPPTGGGRGGRGGGAGADHPPMCSPTRRSRRGSRAWPWHSGTPDGVLPEASGTPPARLR